MPISLTPRAGGFALAVKVVPGSSRQRVAGEYGTGIRISVNAPPEKGAANKSVVTLLAKLLNVPEANIQIIRGHTSARKEILICGLSAEVIRERLIGDRS